MTNKLMQRVLIGAALCLAGALPASQASEFNQQVSEVLDEAKAALDSVYIYRRPQALEGLEEDKALTCRELEQELASLTPKTYSYKPGFYDDPIQGTALWIGTTYEEAYWFVLYGLYYDYQESRRIISAEDRIETLRRVKAQKRCFED